MTRRSLAAPLVGTKPWAHGEQSALPHASCTRTLPRPPQARLANVTTTRSPLKDEPGWTTHTPFPNFGKVEYFCGEGLTGWRVFCPTGTRLASASIPRPLDDSKKRSRTSVLVQVPPIQPQLVLDDLGGRTVKPGLAAFACVLTVSGCAQPKVWMKPGAGNEEFNQARYACLQQGQQP